MKPARSPGSRSPRLLPPIVIERDGASGSSAQVCPVRSPTSPRKLWSYYHRGCVTEGSWNPNKVQPKKPKTALSKTYTPRTKSLPLVHITDGVVSIEDYLENNREVLENYVMENVSFEDLERWMFKKLSLTYSSSPTQKQVVNTKRNEQDCKKDVFMELVKTLQLDPNEHAVLWELARCISSAVGVDAFRVFKVFPDHPNFVQYFVTDSEPLEHTPKTLERADADQVALVLEVAEKGCARRVSRGEVPLFPDTPHQLFKSFKRTDNYKKQANHILYQPILASCGKTAYVVEMWRISESFRASDEETSSSFLVWGSLTLYYCSMYLDKKRERNMSDFLLDVVKAIFEEMVSLDQLIKRILEFAQKLVNADRASLFLVDYRNFELVSTVFDLKYEPGQTRDVEKKEIRMPINRGIAGHVALSGATMNIPDAYSDYRFNREVDEATGYKTVSILCMPIKVQGKVIGVVQMVNKRNDDSFHHEDEMAFEIFSTFFGLALHHARLYDRIMRKEQKYRVALEVLSYHNTCRENEVAAVLNDNELVGVDLNNFYWDPYTFNEFEKCKAVISMFNDLFDMSKFDVMTVTRFILTVKKNYRTVPYHNFDHGWSVAHCMYVIVKNDARSRYNYKMRLALFVACLCHDLDHRGYTNKYMSETASPLAAMYTTSTLEHHHFNITVTILQQDGHNIFSHMSSEEYKEILGLIRQSILATDLAAFFPNLAKMKELHSHSPSMFSWRNNEHRDLAMAISMTAADLSASAKPWSIQIKTVKVIFEEFYDQGDKERAAGRTPIPMMDRNQPDELPACQIGFLSQICIPCYNMLYKILPRTKPMYAMALRNLRNWTSIAERVAHKPEGQTDDKGDQDETLDNFSIEELSDEEGQDNNENITDNEESSEEDMPVKLESAKVPKTESIEVLDDIKIVTWEDEETAMKGEDKIGGKLLKDIEGVTWIDEDGIVMRSSEGFESDEKHVIVPDNL